MPHLSIEYSEGVDARVDMAAFCALMRDAIMATGAFPLGGVRVRAFRATHAVVADGGAHEFIDMAFRIGVGRDLATRESVVEAIYGAAEEHLRPLFADATVALSMELSEINPETSLKRLNTVRDRLGA